MDDLSINNSASFRETVSQIADDTCKTAQEFIQRVNEVQDIYLEYLACIQKANDLEHLLPKQLLSVLDKNDKHLQVLQAEMDELQEQILEREQCHARLAGDVAKAGEDVREKEEFIKVKRDQILACKLLTKTEFCYNTTKVSGIIKHETPVSFQLDPQKMSNKEISKTLWDLVLNVKK